MERRTLDQRPDARDSSLGPSPPSTECVPEVGNTSPSSIRIVVVLPEPFGPRKPYTDPAGTARSRESTAVAAPKRLVSPADAIAALIRTPPPR